MTSTANAKLIRSQFPDFVSMARMLADDGTSDDEHSRVVEAQVPFHTTERSPGESSDDKLGRCQPLPSHLTPFDPAVALGQATTLAVRRGSMPLSPGEKDSDPRTPRTSQHSPCSGRSVAPRKSPRGPSHDGARPHHVALAHHARQVQIQRAVGLAAVGQQLVHGLERADQAVGRGPAGLEEVEADGARGQVDVGVRAARLEADGGRRGGIAGWDGEREDEGAVWGRERGALVWSVVDAIGGERGGGRPW